MIRTLALAATLIAVPALAQAPGTGSVVAPYSPAGAVPPPGLAGTGPSALGLPASPATVPQPSAGIAPPVGMSTAGTIGDGRVGTLAPGGATRPAVTGQPGLPTTSGVSETTPTTNPPPQ